MRTTVNSGVRAIGGLISIWFEIYHFNIRIYYNVLKLKGLKSRDVSSVLKNEKGLEGFNKCMAT